jgi:hypothetical protein
VSILILAHTGRRKASRFASCRSQDRPSGQPDYNDKRRLEVLLMTAVGVVTMSTRSATIAFPRR